MAEKDFYLLIILSVITGFLLIRIVMARIGRHRQSRRLEREIAAYVRKKAAGQHNWKRVESMKKKILIVEDNKDSREILSLFVTKFGHEVVKAGNSQEAITYAEAECPDLILMDLDLPDADGIKTTAILKKNPKTSHIPVVAVTAWMSALWEERALRVGIETYLIKPVSPQTLKETIEEYARRSLTRGELRFWSLHFVSRFVLVSLWLRQGQAEDYYIYRGPNGAAHLRTSSRPPGSKIIKQQNLPEATDSQAPQGQRNNPEPNVRTEGSQTPSKNK